MNAGQSPPGGRAAASGRVGRGTDRFAPRVPDSGAGAALPRRRSSRASSLPTPTGGAAGLSGFTLIEIMIVISIVAIVFAMGVPPLFRMMQKDAMRQAVSDVLEACQRARAEAILRDTTTEMRFDLEDGGIWDLTVVERPKHRAEVTVLPPADAEPAPAVASTPAPIFKAQLSDRIVVDALGVNFKDAIADKEPPAPVRFYANGTCDEFTILMHWLDQQQWRKITLDIITGQPDVEMVR